MDMPSLAGVAAGISGVFGLLGFIVYAVLHLNSKPYLTPEMIKALTDEGLGTEEMNSMTLTELQEWLKSRGERTDAVIDKLAAPELKGQHQRLMHVSFGLLILALVLGIVATVNSSQPSSADAGKVLWKLNWHTMNEPRGYLESSGKPEDGGGSFTNREKFLAALRALDLSEDETLEELRAQLVALVKHAPPHPQGEPYYNMRVTQTIEQVEGSLRRGIRDRAIKAGVEIQLP